MVIDLVKELLFGAIGVILGALIAFWAQHLLLRYKYKCLYAEIVSKSRIEWINAYRDEVATIVTCLRQNDDEHIIYEAEKARAKLLTRLNCDTSNIENILNPDFTKLLKDLDFEKGDCDNQIERILEISKCILEFEWKRVKKEAKGEYKK